MPSRLLLADRRVSPCAYPSELTKLSTPKLSSGVQKQHESNQTLLFPLIIGVGLRRSQPLFLEDLELLQ